MLNFKQFVLQDARSHPELNPKVSINQRLKDYYNRAPNAPPNFGFKKNAFVSFTKLEKLGLNPDTEHDTPLAICSYSLDYAIREMGERFSSEKSLPYAGNEPYANCFSVKGNIININNLNSEFKTYKVKLNDICKENGLDYVYLWKDAKETAYIETLGGIFWNMLRLMSDSIGDEKRIRPAIVWNGLIRKLGIDGFIDNGQGILHTNELFQQMFFHMKCIYNIERYDNKWSPVRTSPRYPQGLDAYLQKKMIHKKTSERVKKFLENNNVSIIKTNYIDEEGWITTTIVASLNPNITKEKFSSLWANEFESADAKKPETMKMNGKIMIAKGVTLYLNLYNPKPLSNEITITIT